MRQVRKAIIPAAGLGTRFLPATKAMPKEMLPLVDKPAIQYIVEEAVAAGIEDIIIVTGKGKRAIEDHFDYSFELEQNLMSKGKFELLSEVKKSSQLANLHYIRQKEPLGLGHAIWCARKFIGDEPFAVLLGDDIIEGFTPCIAQMIEQYEEHKGTILGVKKVKDEEVSRYGIIDGEIVTERLHTVRSLIEKPDLNQAPSNLAIMGRYILPPSIFDILSYQEPGRGNEIQLTDALATLNHSEPIFAFEFQGERYDVGERLGYIQTSIEFALKREDLQEELLGFLQTITERYPIK
ncbi:UTP--glucose-1-phosphate uridylyltransferase GalU [Cytobacillus sp. FSL W7-1323]|uniref:UTP--glucose-1-phosphate uridylyltransferase n=1 Tax=Cytobacillus kochii TaxID=859143 RepID=A0A248TJZ7_9BACI|nr:MULTISPECIES: UTP--glucose-1-phosphate uridylyltransferase GalU [Cytobacillus]ASV68527.1 UTP--glucose-1-phosphate uridylyltransferase [Cytobacillus kochii]MEA1855250.1 UTP--glucose-1-phosphate uridylyltransferase GalU [Cytobacillus sp. OWB-43]